MSEVKQIEQVSLDEVSKRFEAHLGVENNFRIVFSGKYGTGKSYFINNFFNSRKERYNKFILSPVNYVVSSNEDIFELIKIDIIKKLFFEGYIKYEKSAKKKKTDIAWQMIHEKPFITIKHVISAFKKINPYFEIADSFLEGMEKLKKEFDEYEKELSKNLNLNNEQLAEFVDGYVETPGNIFEENFITRTINTFLESITDNGEKENILVIDDLDRIDPEHVFRILNVLSAHNNYWDEKNKFRFHKIILVCDIDNIQKIFHHKYGEGVDFQGYMDKFFSTDIFGFSNNDAIKLHIDKNIGNQLSVQAKSVIAFILIACLDKGKITLRKILKSNFNLSSTDYELARLAYSGQVGRSVHFLKDPVTIWFSSKDLEILKVIKVLSMIWGDFQFLKRDFKSIQDSGSDINYIFHQSIFNFLVLPLHVAQKFQRDNFLYFTKESANQGEKVFDYEYPTQHIFGMQYRINLNWMSGRKYDGSVSYFSGVTVSPLLFKEKFILTGGLQQPIERHTISKGQFFGVMVQILEAFERFKFLQQLGI